MISHTLLEKLFQLRLTAFRKGLQEQSSNPQCADLPYFDPGRHRHREYFFGFSLRCSRLPLRVYRPLLANLPPVARPVSRQTGWFNYRFNKKATLIVSQVPVTDWHLRFPDPTLADAILDRSIHNAYRFCLTGNSQRKLRGNRTMSHT